MRGGRGCRSGQLGQQLVDTRPFGRVLRQAALDQRPQTVVGHGAQVRRGLDDPEHDGVLVARTGPERQLSGGRVHQHTAEGEDVRPGPGLLAEDLFGRHESRGADDHTGAGQQRFDRHLEGAGDAEVDDPGAVGGQQDVGGLEVAVDDPGGVNPAQGAEQPLRQGVDGLHGQRAVLPYGLFQGGAGHIAGGHPRLLRVRVGVEHRGGPAPADPPGALDLPPETRPELPVGDVLLVHDLHGHGAPARRTGQIHAAHAAGAEPAEQRVGPDPGGIADREGAYAVQCRAPPVALPRTRPRTLARRRASARGRPCTRTRLWTLPRPRTRPRTAARADAHAEQTPRWP